MNTTQQQLHMALQRITELEKEAERVRRYIGCIVLASANLNIDWNALDAEAKKLMAKGDSDG